MSNQNEAVQIPAPPADAPVKTFTAEDIEKARKEEKDKLYKRMETFEQSANEVKAIKEQNAKLQEQLETLAQAEQARQAEREKAEQEAAEARRLAEEAEMDAATRIQSVEERWKQQMAEKDKQWASQFEQLTAQTQMQQEILAKERALAERNGYIQQRMQQEEEVIPVLWDLVTGNTPEEIEVSIATLREKSAAILAASQEAAPPQLFPGARVTAPLVENHSEQQVTFTPQQIAAMDLNTFAKYRDQLLKVRPGQQGPSPY